jgi:hypothetical protein
MGRRLAVFAIEAVEFLFFAGLAGCVVVVVYSWISVLKGCFVDKN